MASKGLVGWQQMFQFQLQWWPYAWWGAVVSTATWPLTTSIIRSLSYFACSRLNFRKVLSWRLMPLDALRSRQRYQEKINVFAPSSLLWGSFLENKNLATICSGRVPGACPPCVRHMSALSPLLPHLQTLSAMCPPCGRLASALCPS